MQATQLLSREFVKQQIYTQRTDVSFDYMERILDEMDADTDTTYVILDEVFAKCRRGQ